MRALSLGQRLVIMIPLLGLILLIVSILVLGAAIRHGTAGLPTVNVQYSTIHIVAYTTHCPDGPPFTICPPQSVASSQSYYAIWHIDDVPTVNQPYGRTATCLLVVSLRA